MLLWIVGAVAGAALMLLFPDGIRKTLVPCLVSYARHAAGRCFSGHDSGWP